ncbi:gliding motility-associated C-terminal domain-containing protein [Lacinutrix sp. Hel_I_90]|uniref:gliding motility-associated C-terminal domain-containing protein n=1 Tax=Lacinutrix sp. Hel_I_90 TaxID=1249999 RepID=UPI0005C97A66|nr:T9SS C-terminal target domain-containing protein [Lacinutrix sp. Hel_I_90]
MTTEADNCDTTLEATYSDSTAAGSCANASVITRTWTLTDDCNNTTTAVQTITIEDTTAPSFTVPADITINCEQDPSDLSLTGDVTTEADNCDTTLEATYSDTTAAGSCANASVITRTWTLSDDCNNTTTAVQTITIEDTTAPSFTVPADITINCEQDPSDLSLTGDVTTEADNCDTTLEATYSDATAAGSCANASVITRTWTLSDDCNNTTTAVQTITIEDTTAPSFTVPADITINCEQDPSDLSLTGDVTTEADNCDTTLEATYSDATAAGSCANASVITRTWTLTDDCNNTTTAVQTITIEDTTAPSFTVPADITINCEQDPTDLSLTGDVTTEADNCDTTLEATYSDTTAAGSCANASVITRTWTLTDDCNNTTTAVQTITIEDTTAPSFTVPADITINCEQDPSDLSLTGDVTTEADNCDTTLEATYSDSTANNACTTVITRTWTLTDDCNNTTTAVQTITIEDTTAPELISPIDTTINVVCSEIPEIPTVEFSDNCSSTADILVVFEETNGFNENGEDYQIIREWTVSDACENTAVYTQILNVSNENTVIEVNDERCTDDGNIDLFDYLAAETDTTGTWEIVSGNTTITDGIFDPLAAELGAYVFSYVSTTDFCRETTRVTIDINDDCVVLPCGVEAFKISKAITPNGDGYNDFFAVQGLSKCGFVINLKIFNRYGGIIFESENYQNDWDGSSIKTSLGGADKLPNGTYYYVIVLKDSGLDPMTGPLYLGTK